MDALALLLYVTVAIPATRSADAARPWSTPAAGAGAAAAPTPIPIPAAEPVDGEDIHSERMAEAPPPARRRAAPKAATSPPASSATADGPPRARDPAPGRGEPDPRATPIRATSPAAARWRPGNWRPPENLLAGPARCLLRYLEAVRQAGPRPERGTGRLPAPHERDYAAARALTAPRTLEEIERLGAGGDDHPLAPWREAARAHVLESFQLVAVRRAPRGAAVVTVAESFWRPPGEELERNVAEYLVARVDGQWKIVARSPNRAFDDDDLREGYAGFFDDPAATR